MDILNVICMCSIKGLHLTFHCAIFGRKVTIKWTLHSNIFPSKTTVWKCFLSAEKDTQFQTACWCMWFNLHPLSLFFFTVGLFCSPFSISFSCIFGSKKLDFESFGFYFWFWWASGSISSCNVSYKSSVKGAISKMMSLTSRPSNTDTVGQSTKSRLQYQTTWETQNRIGLNNELPYIHINLIF